MASKRLEFANPQEVPDLEKVPTMMPPPPPRRKRDAVPAPQSAPESIPLAPVAPAEGPGDLGAQEAVQRPRRGRPRSTDAAPRYNSAVDVEAGLAQRVRDAYSKSGRGSGKRGLTLTALVLIAVREQQDQIKDLWQQKDVDPGELFPGLAEQEKAASESVARAKIRLQLSGLIPEYTEALDALVTEYGAPSRNALIEAALERQYPPKSRR